MKVGPDLSHWQSSVDLTRAQDHLDFAFLKATESTGYVDPTFAARWATLEGLNIPRGAYHFAHPAGSVADQVGHFLRTVEPHWSEGDVPVLDLEGTAMALAGIGTRGSAIFEGDSITSTRQDVPWDTVHARAVSPAMLVGWAGAWLNAVRQRLGAVPVLYTNPSFYRDTMGNPHLPSLGGVGWIARYGVADPWAAPWTRLNGWPEVPAIWQCGNGVTGCSPSIQGLGVTDWNQMTNAAFDLLFGPPAGMARAGEAPTHQTREEVLTLLDGPNVLESWN